MPAQIYPLPNEDVIADSDSSRFARGRNEFESLNSPISSADAEAPPGDDSGVVRAIPIRAYCPYNGSSTNQEEFFTENGELLLTLHVVGRLPILSSGHAVSPVRPHLDGYLRISP